MRSEKELQILQSAINRAWADPSFKAELISSPVEAIQKASGVNVSTSGDRELVVLDQTDPNFVYINIPPKPDAEGSYKPLDQLPERLIFITTKRIIMQMHKNQEVFQVFQDIIEKAWENPAYKQELIARPTETIEQFIGAKLNLPEGMRIVVRDQSDESYTYLNIPQKFSQDELVEMELTDEQLETVAGGEGPFIVSYIVGTIGVALGAYALGQMHHNKS